MRRLTKMQRRILAAMDANSFATFTGTEARKRGFAVFDSRYGGVVIRAYGNPAYFLEHRGLIDSQKRSAPGRWYRITRAGVALIRNIDPRIL
jgi:hypothetical protein